MKAPYPGQGLPLPSDMPRGYWVVEGAIYLSCDDVKLPLAAPEWARPGEWDAHASVPPGLESVGFGAERVARGMQIPVDELLEANRQGALRVSVSHVDRGRGRDPSRICFVFEYHSRRFEVMSRR